jgi:hypothetical protein
MSSWQRKPWLERNHCFQVAMAATAAPPVMPTAATTTVVQSQIDLSISDSYSSADDDSGSCKIVEPVGDKGKTSFICLSGDV